VYNGIYPYLIGPNGVENQSAVLPGLDSLCNFSDVLNVAVGQTRTMFSDNLDLRARAKEERTTKQEASEEGTMHVCILFLGRTVGKEIQLIALALA
jgi:hypothetical protein